MSKLAGVALNPGEHIHYIDHLAPVACALGIPLLFHNEEKEAEIRAIYPGLKTEFLPFDEFNPEWLMAHYDFSVLSDQWKKDIFHAKFKELEIKYGKHMRNVHCPHGFSDKGFYLKDCAFEDICLVYGQNMLDLLQEWKVLPFLKNYLITGNIRYAYYRHNENFYQKYIEENILSRFVHQAPIVLYAPTCMDKQNSSSFFSAGIKILQNFPNHFNLIVKLHPQLEQTHPLEFYQTLAQFEKKPNFLFVTDLPLIYPLLSISDIYLGDFSSIGYDFLAFDRPMYFINHKNLSYPPNREAFLFQCGTVIEPENISQFFNFLEQNLHLPFSEKRQAIYNYTFGPPKSCSEIKKEVAGLLRIDP